MTVSQRVRSILAALSGGLILLATLLWVTGVPETLFLRHGLLAAAAVIAGYPIALNAIRAIRFRAFSIELLVTIAVIGALAGTVLGAVTGAPFWASMMMPVDSPPPVSASP